MAKADDEREEALQSAEKAKGQARELRKDLERVEKLNRKLRRDYNKVSEEPNIVQLAVTGTSVVAGTAGGVYAHRFLRKTTQTWLKPVDPNDQTAIADIDAFKKGTSTQEQRDRLRKTTTRTVGAALVSEVLPGGVGLVAGGLTAMSDNGVVASLGGLGWGFAGGILLDLLLPGPPPPPPVAPKP